MTPRYFKRLLFAFGLAALMGALTQCRAATIAFSGIALTNVVKTNDLVLVDSALGGTNYATRTATVATLLAGSGGGSSLWVTNVDVVLSATNLVPSSLDYQTVLPNGLLIGPNAEAWWGGSLFGQSIVAYNAASLGDSDRIYVFAGSSSATNANSISFAQWTGDSTSVSMTLESDQSSNADSSQFTLTTSAVGSGNINLHNKASQGFFITLGTGGAVDLELKGTGGVTARLEPTYPDSANTIPYDFDTVPLANPSARLQAWRNNGNIKATIGIGGELTTGDPGAGVAALKFGSLHSCSAVTMVVTQFWQVSFNGVTSNIPLVTITP